MLSLFGTWIAWQQRGGTPEPAVLLAESVQHRVTQNLPLGSTVTLRPHSSLMQVASTDTEQRYRVHGEAYFEVSGDEERTFLVELAGTVVRVTGTRFVAHSSNKKSGVFVEEGSVRFESADGTQSRSLGAGMALEFLDDRMSEPRATSPEIAMAWLRDELVMDSRTAAAGRPEPLNS